MAETTDTSKLKVGCDVQLKSGTVDFSSGTAVILPNSVTNGIWYRVIKMDLPTAVTGLHQYIYLAQTSNSDAIIKTDISSVASIKVQGGTTTTNTTTNDRASVFGILGADAKPYSWGPASTDADADSNNVLSSEINKLFENSTANGKTGLTSTTRLFGIPYQFMESVDPRIPNISSILGAEYCRNIITEAPILTIMPGKPKYLGKNSNLKDQVSSSLLSNGGGSMSGLAGLMNANSGSINTKYQLRYYDFEVDYTSYMTYVNLMCRVAAGYLGIESKVMDPITKTKLADYKWQNYRFDGSKYITAAESVMNWGADRVADIANDIGQWAGDTVEKAKEFLQMIANADAASLSESTGKSSAQTAKTQYSINQSVSSAVSNSNEPVATPVTLGEEVDDDVWGELFAAASVNKNYVQFYIDPTSFNETSSNQTQASMLDNIFNQGSAGLKEFQFILGSAGAVEGDMINAVANFAQDSASALTQALGNASSQTATLGVMNRIANVGGNLIKGESMIFPEIYMKSDYSKSYSVNISLKTPYGDKYSYYINILVPLFHLVALTAPRQSTANTYSSPFIVRCMIPGIVNCTLGIVESVNITKNPSGDGLSVDGYPLEVTVNLVIKDLYADLMISPTTDPSLFLTNSGLMDYLAINCGLDVTAPNYAVKIKQFVNTNISAWRDIPSNVGEVVMDSVNSWIFGNNTW